MLVFLTKKNGHKLRLMPVTSYWIHTEFQWINNIIIIPCKLWKMLSEVLKWHISLHSIVFLFNFGACRLHFSPIALLRVALNHNTCFWFVPSQSKKLKYQMWVLPLCFPDIPFFTGSVSGYIKKPSKDGRPCSGLPCNDNKEVHEAYTDALVTFENDAQKLIQEH